MDTTPGRKSPIGACLQRKNLLRIIPRFAPTTRSIDLAKRRKTKHSNHLFLSSHNYALTQVFPTVMFFMNEFFFSPSLFTREI